MARPPAGSPRCASIRPGGAPSIAFPPHDGELVFGFVLEGSASLDCRRQHRTRRRPTLSSIPPGEAWALTRRMRRTSAAARDDAARIA